MDNGQDPDFPIEEDDVEKALVALDSQTARDILTRLYDRPKSVEETAEHLGLDVETVEYHVKNLEAADLVTPIDSDDGRVYGVEEHPMVLFVDWPGTLDGKHLSMIFVEGIALSVLLTVGLYMLMNYVQIPLGSNPALAIWHAIWPFQLVATGALGVLIAGLYWVNRYVNPD